MRVTNGMLINNSLSHINTNKSTMDRLNTQLASEKVIQRPSDDPIIAIRALRFRTTIAEIDQYIEKNISDARSWMETTEEALGTIVDIVGDITEYCNQAVNGYYDATDKNTILDSLKSFREQIYSNANTDYTGMTIFTGFKTDQMLTYVEDKSDKYQITEHFNLDDVDTLTKVKNAVDVSKINDATIASTNTKAVKLPTLDNAYRVRLAYQKLDDTAGVTIKTTNPDEDITGIMNKKSSDPDAYTPGEDDVYYLADKGELVLGSNAYAKLMAAEKFDVTYTKSEFLKGDLSPKQYFDCVDMTDDDSSKWVTYTNRSQEIKYEINFNQTMVINTQGKDVFTPDMKRDLDDIIDVVNVAVTAEEKRNKIKDLYNNADAGSAEKAKYKELLDLCEREVDFSKENMKNAFSRGLTAYKNHQSVVSLARANVGVKLNRLDLNESRLESQRVTIDNLKSINEEANVVNVAIELEEASSIYDASLAAASKVVQKKLLDFL